MKHNTIFALISLIVFISLPLGLTTSAAQAPAQPQVELGEPGLSYRYVQTYGETQVPYLADNEHLNQPGGTFIDQQDNLFVAENSGFRVLGYDNTGAAIFAFGHAGVPGFSEGYLNFPWEVTTDSDGNVWLVESHAVYAFDPLGNVMLVYPQDDPWNPGNDNSHFNEPSGIVFDKNGYLIISDYYNHRVQVYSVSDFTLTYINTIGETGIPGDDDLHFNSPARMVVDSSNALYVMDSQNFRVQKCSSTDDWVSWSCTKYFGGTQGTDPGNGEMGWAYGIGIDVDDNIFIADGSNYRVLKCTPDGTCSHFVGTLGEPGNDNSHFDSVADVSVDSMGKVYVSDRANMRIQVYNDDATYFSTIGVTEEPYIVDDEHYNQPWGVAVANNGGLYVQENAGCRLIKLNPDGNQAWTFGKAGVCGAGNDQLGYNSWWGDSGNPTETADGKVYLPDNPNNRIQIIDVETGEYQSTFGEYGQGENQFAGPYDIAINPANLDILVADDYNHRIEIFSSEWVYKTTIGETGVAGNDAAHFNRPKGVAVDDAGAVYVADSENARIQKCTTTDQLVYTCDTLIAGVYDWNPSLDQLHPEGVVLDASGKVYVTSEFFSTVKVYDPSGAYLATIGGTCNSNSGSLCYQQVSAVDPQGNVYVADLMNHRIQKFSPGIPDWKQVNINGFGSQTAATVTVRPFNEQLYAGAGDWAYGAQVWRTTDGTTWNLVTTPGEGLGAFSGVILGMIEFDGKLYVGTGWGGSPPEIWRTANGTDWEQVMVSANGDAASVSAFAVFENRIYAALPDGSEDGGVAIYRSSSGNADSWLPIVTHGRGDVQNTTIYDFAVFNNQLYAVGANTSTGAFVWRYDGSSWTQVNTPGFDNTTQNNAQSIAVYNDTLYVGTACYQPLCTAGYEGAIYKSIDGTDWSLVVTGFEQAGYGDVTSLYSFDGALFAAVAGRSNGNTIWRTMDGTSWLQVNIDGWGDNNNVFSMLDYAITSYNNQLYVGTTNYSNGTSDITSNLATGTKVWRYEPEVFASFTAEPTSGVVPLEVTFTNTSTGTLTANLWDFGDGITSTLTSPIHTYEATGVYSVSLTVESFGNIDTITISDLIMVENRQFFLPVIRR